MGPHYSCEEILFLFVFVIFVCLFVFVLLCLLALCVFCLLLNFALFFFGGEVARADAEGMGRCMM